MKQVKTYQYSSDKETLGFKVEIKLAADFRLYFSTNQIPAELQEHMTYPGDRFYGNDFSDLDSVITAAIEKYEESFMTETREKVIAYYYVTDDTNWRHGLQMSFGYQIIYRYTRGEETCYQTLENDRGRQVWRNARDPFNSEYKHKEMIWTQEREDWFDKTQRAFEALAEQIKRGLSGSPTVLARKIEQNVKLLGQTYEA
jgi:hypothetical protein